MTKINIPLFIPNVTPQMKKAAYEALGQRSITQGATTDAFEKKLEQVLGVKNALGVNCATSALELAYHLLDLAPGDEIIVPVFTCTADTVLLERRGIKIVFADVTERMLLDWNDVKKKLTKKTKAIVNVHLFGQLNETHDLGIPVIGDAAQYLGKTVGERFTVYSFQATKIITTVDGGALVCANSKDYKRARLLRWYGIDRDWGDNLKVDIPEAGFKNHMNNVTAAIGLAAIKDLPKLKKNIKVLQKRYFELLKDVPGIKLIGGSPFLIHTAKRDELLKYLNSKGIGAGLGHRRNDTYSVFGGKRLPLSGMNEYEKTYMLLPCRANMAVKEVDLICKEIKKFSLGAQ